MNENEMGRIAAAVNCLRPDWPIGSLTTLLNRPELIRRPRRDVAVALVWVACDSATKTPARVIEGGPWWMATSAEGGEDRRWAPPKDHQACGKHPGEWRDRCRACTADRLAGESEEQVERTPRTEAIAAAKAAAASAAAATKVVTELNANEPDDNPTPHDPRPEVDDVRREVAAEEGSAA